MADLSPVTVGGGNEADYNQHQTACESYLQALKEAKLCDVVFTFENCDDRIEAHQLFLRLRSPVFFVMFRRNVGKTKEVQITGVSPKRFQEFLEYVYADKFEVNIIGALDLLHLGHKYKVSPLIKKCEQLLKTEIKVEDSVQLFETARKYQHADLEEKAGDVMAKNLEQISQTDGFLSVQEDTLLYLLQRDDLTVDEVDLFRLVVKWGENKLKNTAEPTELKTVLANLLPLVRLPCMTLSEFASDVVPSNLLSAEETIAVFSYFGSDEDKRQNIPVVLHFSTKPRKSEKIVSLVQFNTEDAATTESQQPHVGYRLKECLSFSPIYEVSPKQWHRYSSGRPAITGILVHWPKRHHPSLGYEYDGSPNFKVSVKWRAAAISDQSVGQKFETTSNGTKTEISVEPPVELYSGATYCITVEDQSNHFYAKVGSFAGYFYSQNTAPSGIPNDTISVSLRRFPLKLKMVEKNMPLHGSLHGFAAANFRTKRVIQGLRISVV